jgi:hypothetical protein
MNPKKCINTDNKLQLPNMERYINRVKYVIMEYAELPDFCVGLTNNIIKDNKQFKSVLFQIYFTLATLYIDYDFIHGDLHIRNILFTYDLNYVSNSNRYYEYVITDPSGNEKRIYIKVIESLCKIIDFDASSYKGMAELNHKLKNREAIKNSKNGGFKYNIHFLNNIIFKPECDIYKFKEILTYITNNILNPLGLGTNKPYTNAWLESDMMSLKFLYNDLFKDLYDKPNDAKIVRRFNLNITDNKYFQ